MFSTLRKGFVYTDISPDIVEHDLDVDADQWSYDDKDVYRGSFDPRYTSEGLNVYWLYDDNLKRIGLAEHDSEDPEVYKALWFYENAFATLTQDTNWKSTGKTIWSKLTNEAYQDCLEDDFKTVHNKCLSSGVLLVTPEILQKNPDIYRCSKCSKKSLIKENVCSPVLDSSSVSILFVDDDFIVYERDRGVLLPTQQCGAYDHRPAQEELQAVQPGNHLPHGTPQKEEQRPEQPEPLPLHPHPPQ